MKCYDMSRRNCIEGFLTLWNNSVAHFADVRIIASSIVLYFESFPNRIKFPVYALP